MLPLSSSVRAPSRPATIDINKTVGMSIIDYATIKVQVPNESEMQEGYYCLI